MEGGGSRFISMKFLRKMVEVHVIPWNLVEASLEVHRGFRCRWKWKLPLLLSIAASTDIVRASFHELPYTPPTSTSITKSQLLPEDYPEP